jgi:hypothetical protein
MQPLEHEAGVVSIPENPMLGIDIDRTGIAHSTAKCA